MKTIVLTLARTPDRYEETAAHLAELGLEATPFVGIDAGQFAGTVTKQKAICDSYALLLATVDGPTLVIQDDVQLATAPEEPGDRLTILNPPNSPTHICPRAFTVDTDTAHRMAERFATTTVPACKLMATFDHRLDERTT